MDVADLSLGWASQRSKRDRRPNEQGLPLLLQTGCLPFCGLLVFLAQLIEHVKIRLKEHCQQSTSSCTANVHVPSPALGLVAHQNFALVEGKRTASPSLEDLGAQEVAF